MKSTKMPVYQVTLNQCQIERLKKMLEESGDYTSISPVVYELVIYLSAILDSIIYETD